MNVEALKEFQDVLIFPCRKKKLLISLFINPHENSPEIQYLKAKREKLGWLFTFTTYEADETLPIPNLSVFEAILKGPVSAKFLQPWLLCDC